MKHSKQIFRFVLIGLFLSAVCIPATFAYESKVITDKASSDTAIVNILTKQVSRLNDTLLKYLRIKDLASSKIVLEKLAQKLNTGYIDEGILADSYYYIAIYYLDVRNYYEAIHYLDHCISLKEKSKIIDARYAKALYNLGVGYANLADARQFENYALKSLEAGKKIFSDSNPQLLLAYSSLISSYTEMKEYDKAIATSNIALNIPNIKMSEQIAFTLSSIYYSLGLCYFRLADFSKAKIYFDKTESLYKNFNLEKNQEYINLLNAQALTYNAVGLTTECNAYYEEGVKAALSQNSSLANNLINSYSIFLAKDNKTEKGEKLLKDILDRINIKDEFNRGVYIEALNNYAIYLSENTAETKKAIACFEQCIEYLRKNEHDLTLKNSVYKGYAYALEKSGEYEKALDILQSLLFGDNKSIDKYGNPSLATLVPEASTLKILKLKYEILWNIYNKTSDRKMLEMASNTSELIVSMLDKVRININEEESRLILGDNFRESYINAIKDFDILYTQTNDQHFLEKAFEYAEKSKVAGLLTSTRELKATQFQIPVETGNLERQLQLEISLLNVHISEESSGQTPNMALIAKWKENLLKFSRKRDSLIMVFEKQYPDYYAIKYNTHIATLKEIPGIVGSDGNYINYVISKNVLYTFIVNRKHKQLLSFPIDSSFFGDIRRFRSFLTIPLSTDNEELKFESYQTVGYRLYKKLIEPVKPYLISDKVYISPDNFLSYLPFETIPASVISDGRIRYGAIHYLMNDLDISYTYSATFMAESEKKESGSGTKLIAFAPDYPEPIDIQSALMSRQGGMGVLNDLPYARQEAKYVTDLTGGKLYENSNARESIYKVESGKYDIIHLAMHTLLDEKDPMRSTLIFSHKNDSLEDGYLKTYEIYGIPLKAKMVVLSSCNTGSGLFYSGEGILSLARGFIYSGSQSVVMSMWEIEDKSGTEIVKMFYDNLEKGYTKSVALKRARSAFLKNADNLRSHPYFWSALVVYGNNSPLYHSNRLVIIIISVLVIFGLGFYFWKRRYS